MTLSVVIANFNHAKYLPESLDAILAQSHPADEILIVDDASTDPSIDLIESYRRKHPTIRLIRHERNQGAVAAFNRGLDEAKSEFICMFASDDRVLPGHFEKSIGILKAHPEAGLVCSHPAFLNDETGEVDDHPDWYRYSPSPAFLPPAEVARVAGPNGLWIASHTTISRKRAVFSVGKLRGELKWHCDWFLSHAIAFRFGICYLPDALAALRVLPTSYSGAGMKDPVAQAEVLWMITEALKSPEFSDVRAYFTQSSVLDSYSEHKAPMVEALEPWRAWANRGAESRRLEQLESRIAELEGLTLNRAINRFKRILRAT